MTIGSITVGNFVAGLLSYSTHHSLLWAVVNGIFSWLYVIYWAFAYW